MKPSLHSRSTRRSPCAGFKACSGCAYATCTLRVTEHGMPACLDCGLGALPASAALSPVFDLWFWRQQLELGFVLICMQGLCAEARLDAGG